MTDPRPILHEREGKAPVIANDAGHPLRRYVFSWRGTGHVDGRTWYGNTSRDEFHGIERIERVPRRRRKSQKHNAPMGVRYRFDGDDPHADALTYDEMIERLHESGHEYAGRVKEHPLVAAWQRGDDIEWEPGEPPFPVGTVVGMAPPVLAGHALDHTDEEKARRYEVVTGHSIFSEVRRLDGEKERKPRWVPNRRLVAIDTET